MSKEKLQSIRDKYAKENYDNGESHATSWQELVDNDLSFDNEDVSELMKLAYNKALEDAAENASITYVLDNKGIYDLPVVDKQSIQKLKI